MLVAFAAGGIGEERLDGLLDPLLTLPFLGLNSYNESCQLEDILRRVVSDSPASSRVRSAWKELAGLVDETMAGSEAVREDDTRRALREAFVASNIVGDAEVSRAGPVDVCCVQIWTRRRRGVEENRTIEHPTRRL